MHEKSIFWHTLVGTIDIYCNTISITVILLVLQYISMVGTTDTHNAKGNTYIHIAIQHQIRE